jgi:hypothetical protein
MMTLTKVAYWYLHPIGYFMHRQFKQDRQCTYNVTSRRVHETIAAAEKQ